MTTAADSSSLAWARLLRLPNVFTAQADVFVGLIATGAIAQKPLTATAIIFSSSLLYMGGIVLNDVVDLEEDRRDRPDRPLPSGAVSYSRAVAAAFGLLVGGVLLGMIAAFDAQRNAPLLCAIVLVALILTYNLGGKRTSFGPILLGLCRFANVLYGWTPTIALGSTVIALRPLELPLITAAIMGTYVFVLSALARRETVGMRATIARLWSVGLLLPFGLLLVLGARRLNGAPDWFALIGVALAAFLTIACVNVMRRIWVAATADGIGKAVGGLLSLIVLLDATMIALLGYELVSLPVLALYAPLLSLRRTLYMT